MAAVKGKLSRLHGGGHDRERAGAGGSGSGSARASPVPFGALSVAMPATALGGVALGSAASAALTSSVPSSGAPPAAAPHLSPASLLPRAAASPDLSLGLMSSDLRQLAKATAEGTGAGAGAGRLPTRMSTSTSARQQRQNIQMRMVASGAATATSPDLGPTSFSSGGHELVPAFTTQGTLGSAVPPAKRSLSPEVPKSRFFGSAAVSVGPVRAVAAAAAGGGGGGGGHGQGDDDEAPRDLFGRSTGSLVTAFTPAAKTRASVDTPSSSWTGEGRLAADATPAGGDGADDTGANVGPSTTPSRPAPVDAATHERRELLKALLGRKAIPIPSFLNTAPAGTFGSPTPSGKKWPEKEKEASEDAGEAVAVGAAADIPAGARDVDQIVTSESV
jgi:hypothetical protein